MRELKHVRDYLRSNNNAVQSIVKDVLARTPALDESLTKLEVETILASHSAADNRWLHDVLVDSVAKLDIHRHHPHRAAKATKWLYDVVLRHEKLLTREQQLRMFRSAIEKEISGREDILTGMERLYLRFTAPEIATLEHRVIAALIVVIDLKLVDELAEVAPRLAIVVETKRASQDAREVGPEVVQIFINLVHDMSRPIIDNFACAASLEDLTSKSAKDVVDDNEGCCPICQLSYTDLSSRELEELIQDYPVTIKYCGHTLGKACLERWLRTPKIDEARYPRRTCPICRVNIESVKLPRSPLYEHMKHNRRLQETMRELVYEWGMEVDECLDQILATINKEIAVEELRPFIMEKTEHSTDAMDVLLRSELDACTVWLNQFRDMWGFRGEAAWTKLKREWQAKRADKSLGEGEDVFLYDE